MTALDVATVVGYLMAAAGGMIGVWVLVTRPWRVIPPRDTEAQDPDTGSGAITPSDPQDP